MANGRLTKAWAGVTLEKSAVDQILLQIQGGAADVPDRGYYARALGRVLNLDRAVKTLRAAVRAQATKEKRATCSHPADRVQVWKIGVEYKAGRCRDCGKPFSKKDIEAYRSAVGIADAVKARNPEGGAK